MSENYTNQKQGTTTDLSPLPSPTTSTSPTPTSTSTTPRQSSFARHFRTGSTALPPPPPSNNPSSSSKSNNNPIIFPSFSSPPIGPSQSQPSLSGTGLPSISLIPPRDQAISLDSGRPTMPFFHLPNRNKSSKNNAAIAGGPQSQLTAIQTGSNHVSIPSNTTSSEQQGRLDTTTGTTAERIRSRSPPSPADGASIKRFHTVASGHAHSPHNASIHRINSSSPPIGGHGGGSSSSDSYINLNSDQVDINPGGNGSRFNRRLGQSASLQQPFARGVGTGGGESEVDSSFGLGATKEGGMATSGSGGGMGEEELDRVIDLGAAGGGNGGLYRQSSLPNRGESMIFR